tara:strand:+ start:49 stop:696 length:648 start_codon:yes stop_codon:yes gene_type:complete
MGWFLPALQMAGSLIQHNQNKKAINQAKQMTPAERQYQSRMEKRSQSGDPQYEQKRSRAMSGIRNVAQEAQGQNIQQAMQMGLQDSVIAQELRLRTDVKTMKQISDTSIQMAEQNQQVKDQAQDQLDQFNMQRDERIRQLNQQSAQNTNNMVGNVLGAAGDMFVGSKLNPANQGTQVSSWGGGAGHTITRQDGTQEVYIKKVNADGSITFEKLEN